MMLGQTLAANPTHICDRETTVAARPRLQAHSHALPGLSYDVDVRAYRSDDPDRFVTWHQGVLAQASVIVDH
jgi:hypothetical protein